MNISALAIHIDSEIDPAIIDLCRDFFSAQYDDIVIMTDSILSADKHWAVIPSFYLRFFQGSVLFTDISSYLSYRDKLLTKNILLVASHIDLINSNLDLSVLKNTKIISVSNNSIEVTNYASLRSTL